MSAADHSSSGVAEPEEPDIRLLFVNAWHGLPVLLAGSVLVCVAASLVVLASPGVNPVGVVLTGVVVAPPFAAMVHVIDRLWSGHDVSLRQLLEAVPACWRRGTVAGLVPAIPAALFLVAFEMWDQTAQLWLLTPMSLSGSVGVVAALVAVVALPLSVRRTTVPGRDVWLTSAHAVARHPIPAVAVVASTGLGIWACVTFSASVAVLVPGAVGLTTVAAAQTTATYLGSAASRPDDTTQS